MSTESLAVHDVIGLAFPGITMKQAKEMASIGETQIYDPQVVLCRENAVEETFYVIVEGEVEVTKVINEDEERSLKQLRRGDFLVRWG